MAENHQDKTPIYWSNADSLFLKYQKGDIV